jgi:hypothetical protein
MINDNSNNNNDIICLTVGQAIKLTGETRTRYICKTTYVEVFRYISCANDSSDTETTESVDHKEVSQDTGLEISKVISARENRHSWKVVSDQCDLDKMSCKYCGITKTPQEDSSLCRTKLHKLVENGEILSLCESQLS